MLCKRFKCYFATVFLVTLITTANGNILIDSTENCKVSKPYKTKFIINPIFDTTAAGTVFFHHWANNIHINTKIITLEDQSSFLLLKPTITMDNLAELERHLRGLKYINDAKVFFDNQCVININTWDTWSLTPEISFGRKGGVNKYSYGLGDSNFFGLGIDTNFNYFSNANNSGIGIDINTPLFLKKNTNLGISLYNNDDGKVADISLTKNFVSVNSKYAYDISIYNNSSEYHYFNNNTVKDFKNTNGKYAVNIDWLHNKTGKYLHRYGLGLELNKTTFEDLAPNIIINTNEIPQDIDNRILFLKTSYKKYYYQKLYNIYLINEIEDLNFGWEFDTSLGLVDDKKQDLSYIIKSAISKLYKLTPDIILSAKLAVNYNIYKQQDDKLSSTTKLEFFKKYDNFTMYVKNTNIFSDGRHFTVGDVDDGVRGISSHSVYGDNSYFFSSEIRYYSNINLYKVFNLGGAVFFDIGRVSGAGTISSVGIGSRFYSSKSSVEKTIFIDLVKPILTNNTDSKLGFRIGTKDSF